jgi:hypothetical protein
MDIVSIASFLLPLLLSGHGKLTQGLPMPSPWHKMIHLSGIIYKKLTPGQKIKLVDMGVLPPDFERKLLDVFDSYLTTETLKQQTPSKLQLVLQERSKKEAKKDSPYKQFHETLKMVKPDDVKRLFHNQYVGFLNLYSGIAEKYHPNVKISLTKGVFPNYPDLYEEWKKIHKILVEPKK